MTTPVVLSPPPILAFLDNAGNVAAGGILTTTVGGIPYPTYSEPTGVTTLPNPIILNNRGEIATSTGQSSPLFVAANVNYNFLLTDALGNLIWNQPYLNGALTIITQASLGAIFYPQSAAELSAGVTPANPWQNYGDPRRYGAVGDGVTDDTLAVQTTVNVLQQTGGRLVVNTGCYFMCTADILFTPVTGKTVDVMGPGWDSGGFLFSGAAVTHGLYFNAAVYGTYGPTVRDLRLISTLGAIGGLVFVNLNQPLVDRCFVNSAAGRGIFFNACILPSMSETLVNGCGSPTTGSVEVDGGDNNVTPSTDFNWSHCYIQGGGVTSLGGLLIDHTNAAVVVGGAINSTAGTCIKIASKVATAASVFNITIQNIDLENAGNGSFYIDAGQGIAGASLCGPATVQNIGAYPSGTTMMGSGAVRLANTVGWDFADNLLSLPGYVVTGITQAASAIVTISTASAVNPLAVGFGATFYGVVGMTQINGLFGTVTANGGVSGAWTATVNINSNAFGAYVSGGTYGPICTFNISGTTNLGTRIQPHRGMYGNAYPWAMINAAFIKAAGPHLDWVQGSSPLGLSSLSTGLSGATPSILILAAQGGFYRACGMTNGGATTVTALTGGESGMEITLVAADANTTLTHSTSVANQFNLIANANLAMASGKAYKFIHNGTLWVQV